MASVLGLINRLLPFATPGTPLVQDLVHLLAICLILYFAPSIQEWNRRRQQQESIPTTLDNADHTQQGEAQEAALADHAQHDVAPEVVVNGEHDNEHDDSGSENGDFEDHDPQEGPANERQTTSSQRNVGAKKAKSLARKDQRKAYHEFLRSQGDAQRARDAEGAAEREAALEAEQKRRALAEAELIAKKAREREQKREAEKAERDAEYRRREAAVSLVKADLASSNLSDLHRIAVQVGGDVDVEWVEKVINASGLVGRKGNVLTMITSTGWAATITRDHAMALYDQAAVHNINNEAGNIQIPQMSKLFVDILRQPLFAI